MDNRRKILHILEVSYSSHRGDGRVISNDRDYSCFIAESGIKTNTLKNSIAPEGLLKLFCQYLNGAIVSKFRAPLFGTEWDVPIRYITAFSRMSNTIENEIMPRIDEQSNLHGFMMFEPAGTTGMSIPLVGIANANAPYIATETTSNILRISVRQNAPGNILQFPGSLIGSMLIRTSMYYFNLERQNAELEAQAGFPGALGALDIAISSDITNLRYTPNGGDPIVMTEGGFFQLRGGVLHSQATVTGVYNIELIGLSSQNNDLRHMFQHYSSYVNAFRLAVRDMPETLRPYLVAFLHAIGNGQIHDPIDDAPFIIASNFDEVEIRSLTKVITAITAMS